MTAEQIGMNLRQNRIVTFKLSKLGCGIPLLMALAAHGQVNANQIMNNAMSWLNQQSIVYVQLTGQQTVGSSTKNVDYEGYISRYKIGANGKPVPSSSASLYIDIEAYQEFGKKYVPLYRIVGDGSFMWKYTYPSATYGTGGLNNSYTSVSYVSDPSVAPSDKLLNALSGVTDQFSDQIALLFKEGFASNSPSFQTWIGGATLSTASTANLLIYNNATTQLDYLLSTDTTGDTILDSINFNSSDSFAGSRQSTSWNMTVWALTSVSPTKFQFVPPYGATPIATAHVNGN